MPAAWTSAGTCRSRRMMKSANGCSGGQDSRANAAAAQSEVVEGEGGQQAPRGLVEAFEREALSLVVVLGRLIARGRSHRDRAPGGFREVHPQPVAGALGQRIDESVDQALRARRQLGVLAANRIDRERLAAQHRRQLVRVQSGRVDHRPGAYPLPRRLQLDPARARRPAADGGARQQVDLAAAGERCQGPHQRFRVDDAGERRPERGRRLDRRLPPADETAVHDVQITGAVGSAAPRERLEIGNLRGSAAGDQLPAARVPHVVPGAEPEQLVAPLHAQPGLERAGRVVDAGVDYPAVVGARLHARPRAPFQQARRAAALGDGAGGRQADDPSAHDRDVYLLHCGYRQ